MQDEDCPLIDREPAKRPLQLVAVGDGMRPIGGRMSIHGHDPDGRRPSARPPRFVVAGMNEDPVDPRLEALGIPKARDPPPGEDKGVLQRVLGSARVTQDSEGHGEERVADLVHQDGKRLAVAPTGLLDEVSIHHVPLGGRGPAGRAANYDWR